MLICVGAKKETTTWHAIIYTLIPLIRTTEILYICEKKTFFF